MSKNVKNVTPKKTGNARKILFMRKINTATMQYSKLSFADHQANLDATADGAPSIEYAQCDHGPPPV
jgi:hypothetical protein